MSFGENLKTLRKMTEMSQEQLAEKLDVSRQAVSKWETDEGYPETDKILTICKLFDCSMDELMQGEITIGSSDLRREYDTIYNQLSKGIAFGVGIIILGVIFMLTCNELVYRLYWAENVGDAIGIGGLLVLIAIAVAGFIYFGMQVEHFKERHQTMPQIYSEKEIDICHKNLVFAIVTGVTLLILGVVALIVTEELLIFGADSEIPVIIFMITNMIAVPMFIYSGIQKGKYNIDEYNKENKKEKEIEEGNDIVGRISGVIMLMATAIFLFLGFVYNLWHIAWVVFPIFGIFCGIVSLIFNKE